MPDDRQPTAVDPALVGEEVQRGHRLLLERRDSDRTRVSREATQAGLAAAELVVAQARRPIGRQPVRDGLERVDGPWEQRTVSVAVRRAAAGDKQHSGNVPAADGGMPIGPIDVTPPAANVTDSSTHPLARVARAPEPPVEVDPHPASTQASTKLMAKSRATDELANRAVGTAVKVAFTKRVVKAAFTKRCSLHAAIRRLNGNSAGRSTSTSVAP